MLLLYRILWNVYSLESSSFTFHYASTLSWQLSSPGIPLLIYIPLCFYFINPCVDSFSDLWLIYIPLCFYFIGERNTRRGFFPDLHSTMLLLYRFCGASAYFMWAHLHSTMLLLYQRYFLIFVFDKSNIYIPLCFYFISKAYEDSAESKLIYIPLCFYFICMGPPGSTWRRSNLHSTMLLLYRIRLSSPERCTGRNLHSTMLLLYRKGGFHHAHDQSNLHSTMLLLYPSSLRAALKECLHLHSTMLLLYLLTEKSRKYTW